MLLLSANRKSNMGSPMVHVPLVLTLSDLERARSRSLVYCVVVNLYVTYVFAGSINLEITENFWAGAVFHCPSGFSSVFLKIQNR